MQKQKPDVYFQALSEKFGCSSLEEMLVKFENLIVYLNEKTIGLIKKTILDLLLNDSDLFNLTSEIKADISQYKKVVNL